MYIHNMQAKAGLINIKLEIDHFSRQPFVAAASLMLFIFEYVSSRSTLNNVKL
jgi:hypothetical protein